MEILKKHQKKGEEGFKKFLSFLEEVVPSKREEILFHSYFEDPVYTEYIKSNLITIDDLIELSPDEFKEVTTKMALPVQSLLWAFHETALEELFVEKFDTDIKARYLEEKEYVKEFTEGQRHHAYAELIGIVRKLQESHILRTQKCDTPSSEILCGENYGLGPDGTYISKFPNGKIALIGKMQRKTREGKWKHFYPNGNLFAEGIYISGQKEGPWKIYSEQGVQVGEGEFFDDLKNGEWKELDLSGAQVIINYERGKVIS